MCSYVNLLLHRIAISSIINFAYLMGTNDNEAPPSKKEENTAGTLPPRKKQKVHKRKLKKMQAPPEIELQDEYLVIPSIRSTAIELAGGPVAKKNGFRLKHKEKVPNVVICLVPGLHIDDFGRTETAIPLDEAKTGKLSFFGDRFDQIVPLKLPGKANEIFSTERTLLSEKIDRKDKEELMESLQKTPISIDDLLVKMPDWMDHDFRHFPGSGQELPEDWFRTEPLDHEPRVLALDCEFCQSRSGSQLARISVVDYDGAVVYDEYVKPKEEIVDYKTKFSGITEDIMAKATTTQEDVREKLRQLVSSSDTLVGHSLLFDLNVLKMSHPRVVDTCVIFDHPRKKPYKAGLKWLAKTYLGREIQAGEATGGGHSSVEDCIACLDLVKLKLSRGLFYGQEPDSCLISMGLSDEGSKPVAVIDKTMTDWNISSYGAETVNQYVCISDDKVGQMVGEATKTSKIVFCKISGYSRGGSDEQKTNLNEQLQNVWQSLPENSVFFVIGGSSASPEIAKLQQVKLKYSWLHKQGQTVNDPEQVWTFDKDARLKSLVNEGRKSVCFFTIKESSGKPAT